MKPWQQNLVDRLPESMRRDPKKALVLAGLAVVFALVLLRQFGGAIFAGGPTPRSRAAAMQEGGTSADLSAGAQSGPGGRGATTAAEARGGGRVGRWLATPVRTPDRNLFTMRFEHYQSVASPLPPSAVSVRVVDEASFWDQLAKSLGARADQRKQKQIRIDNLQAAAAQIRVTSTMLGTTPAALIEGRLKREGDYVETTSSGATLSFRIVRIEPRRIVIDRDGIRLELTLTGRASVLQETGGGGN